MKKRDEKYGQFYLITALIIITFIISLAAIYNYARKTEDSRVYSLSNELKIESGKVLDYGAVAGNYPWQEFTSNFTEYAGKNVEIAYITGNNSSPSAFYYDQNGEKQNSASYFEGSIMTVTHNNENYSFELREGENFYFVMSQYIGDEYYVAKS